ncbi:MULTISPECIES: hypothetical protein [Inquilinus]|uniref:UDP-N-acetylmuramyl pentapeptide phosphotransferase/UDP-N-acetylglucosamine-1-phosphate transferase n=1 Tax=Inquilinus ginsengisoli TaxID=363840 RepID=A0ABU1K0Y6_9PROT|nr:hypothetical protein [Inquilinus ginsengisoli]MDR6294521.1 UDP-N-acetylmuramyl pentapeptide phosphotransferase/UDP-N-acetylglucosamine-1-phosphate transferase [Inquilinus ginsengisoli]
MSILLKIIAGLMAALGGLAIILTILGVTRGYSVEPALQLLVSALVLAAIAKLLDDTRAIRHRIEHIQYQVIEEIRAARKSGPD